MQAMLITSNYFQRTAYPILQIYKGMKETIKHYLSRACIVMHQSAHDLL